MGGIGFDVAPQLAGQAGFGGEDAAGDDVRLDFGEPQINLIEPGRIGGREVKVDAGMLFQELPDQRGFVSGKIVEDDVDRLRGPTESDNFVYKADEVLTRMPSGGLAVNAPAGRVQRRIQGERSMAVVLESVRSRA